MLCAVTAGIKSGGTVAAGRDQPPGTRAAAGRPPDVDAGYTRRPSRRAMSMSGRVSGHSHSDTPQGIASMRRHCRASRRTIATTRPPGSLVQTPELPQQRLCHSRHAALPARGIRKARAKRDESRDCAIGSRRCLWRLELIDQPPDKLLRPCDIPLGDLGGRSLLERVRIPPSQVVMGEALQLQQFGLSDWQRSQSGKPGQVVDARWMVPTCALSAFSKAR